MSRRFRLRAVAAAVAAMGSPDSGLSFRAPLQTSLRPTLAKGSATPTFTRATTKTFRDFEGVVRTALSGEACFEGARRVRNLQTATEDLGNAGSWTRAFTPTITTGITDPNGGTSAIRITNSAGGNAGVLQSAATVSGNTYCSTWWIRRVTGSGAITFQGTNTSEGSVTITGAVTTSWRRVSALFTATSTSVNCYPFIGTTNDAIEVAFPMLEDVTGQANQNPSEYVSVGVLSAPYHGAGVDGVKYFSTKNGNTVSSNVVTEATGAAIGAGDYKADASGPYGYFAEGARTNLATYSQEFGNAAWSASNVTVVANQYTAPDGTTTMDKATADAGSALHYLQQNGPVATAVPYTLAFDLKYVNCQYAIIGLYDGTNAFWAVFDLLNGVVGGKHASATSTITARPDGVYRCTMTATPAAAALYLQVGPANASSPASGIFTSWSAAGTEVIGIWGAQLEAATFASSYIPTTSASVTRNADVLTYAVSGNLATTGSYYAEVVKSTTGDFNYIIANFNGSGAVPLYLNESSSGKLHAYTGSAVLTGGNFTPSSSVQKLATSFGASNSSAVNGTVTALGAGSLSFSASTFAVGCAQDGRAQGMFFGNIRNVNTYGRTLSDARLQQLTT